jgi:hypothetical protein
MQFYRVKILGGGGSTQHKEHFNNIEKVHMLSKIVMYVY